MHVYTCTHTHKHIYKNTHKHTHLPACSSACAVLSSQRRALLAWGPEQAGGLGGEEFPRGQGEEGERERHQDYWLDDSGKGVKDVHTYIIIIINIYMYIVDSI